MVTQLKPSRDKDDVVHKDLTAKSNSLPDADVLLFFAGRLGEANEKKKEATKAVTGIRKQMVSAGIQLAAFDAVSKALEEGPDAIFDYMKQFQHVAQAFALPIGAQMTLFQTVATDGLSAEGLLKQAERDGYTLGIMGKSPDEQKYHPGTDLGQAHLAGWNAGQEELQRRFVAMNVKAQQEEAEKKAKSDAAAKKREERLAKAKGAGEPPKTEEGQTEQ